MIDTSNKNNFIDTSNKKENSNSKEINTPKANLNSDSKQN